MSGLGSAANNRRQAHTVLAAFRFQLIQTSIAWINLSPGQTLLIEHLEDFDVASPESGRLEGPDIAATQAKYSRTSRSLTLASSEATDALSKFWDSHGGSINVRLVVQTNLSVGKERAVSFPDRKPGIVYWEDVRRGAPLTPLRDALLHVLPTGRLREWLSSSTSDEDIRDRLVRRVSWSTGEDSGVELSAKLQELLSGRLSTIGLPPELAPNLGRQLSDYVFEQATDNDPDLRRLDAKGLNTFLYECAVGLSSNPVWSLSPWTTRVEDTPLPRPCAARRGYVAGIAEVFSASDALWIHGASGSGKSVLAQQVAEARSGSWLLVEFRELSLKRDILLRLSRTYSDIVLAGQVAGVILDDLDADVVASCALRFGRFLSWAGARGTRVILTSSRLCSPTTAATLALPKEGIVNAAYLELEDVESLVREAGAPEEMAHSWAFFIHVASSLGHPQLVAAKVASLRQRAWPAVAITEDVVGAVSEAYSVTRGEARRRLMADATDAGRALLRRLACVQIKFDRQMAVRVAEVDPRIPDPAASLDFLVGPWIENFPGTKGYLRLSPLLAGLNEDVPATEAQATRVGAAVEIVRRGPMDLEGVSIAFWNSVAAKHGWLLVHIQEAFLKLSEEDFQVVAQRLSGAALLRTNEPIFPDDLATSVTVRLMQLRIVAATNDQDKFRPVAIAALEEARLLQPDELRDASLTIGLMTALFARGLRVEWDLRLAWIAEFEHLALQFPHIAQEAQSPILRQMRENIGPQASVAGFFVALGAQTIQSVEDLDDLFQALDRLSVGMREARLQQLKVFHQGYGIYVQQGWATPWFNGLLDAGSAVSAYEKLGSLAATWGDQDLEAECTVAQAVLVDELLARPEDALVLIEGALGRSNRNPILLRQKAKVLGHLSRYQEAGDLLDAIGATIESQTTIERMYAYKEQAVAAGNVGDVRKAALLFDRAATVVADEDDEKVKCHRIALQAEAALCHWRSGERKEALRRLSEVLDDVASVDPQSSDTAFMLHSRTRYAVGYIEADASRPTKDPPRLKFGATSALDIDMGQVERKDKGPFEDVKLMLHAVAVREGYADLFPSLRLEATSPDFVMFLRAAEVDHALARFGPQEIVHALHALCSSLATMRNRRTGQQGEVSAISIRALVAAVAVHAHMHGRFNEGWWDSVISVCQATFSESVATFADLKFRAAGAPTPDIAQQVLAGIRSRGTIVPTPQQRFEFHLNCIQVAMAGAPCLRLLDAITRLLLEDWVWIFDRQRFALVQPQEGEEMLREAEELIGNQTPGGLVGLMEMAAFVLNTQFDPSWIKTFEALGGELKR